MAGAIILGVLAALTWVLVIGVLIWPGPRLLRRRALLQTCSVKRAASRLADEIQSDLTRRNEGKEQ